MNNTTFQQHCAFCQKSFECKDIRAKKFIGKDRNGKEMWQTAPIVCPTCSGARVDRYTNTKHQLRQNEIDKILESEGR